jgi:hypothetical protein
MNIFVTLIIMLLVFLILCVLDVSHENTEMWKEIKNIHKRLDDIEIQNRKR